jgi:hypothetical protein
MLSSTGQLADHPAILLLAKRKFIRLFAFVLDATVRHRAME